MIRYLQRADIDTLKWDACIQNSKGDLPYALSYYLDVVAPDWTALVQDDYVAVMPLPIRNKLLLQYVFRPVLCQQLGLFSTTTLSEADKVEFYKALPKKLVLLDFTVNTSSAVDSGYGDFTTRPNFELDLKPSYEDLLAQYKYNRRREIKLLKKNDLTIESNIRLKETVELISSSGVLSASGAGSEELEIIEKLLQELIDKGIGFSYGYRTDQLEAVVFYVVYKNRIINLINAANPETRKQGVIALLLDRLIMDHAGKSYFLDFEGSSIPSIASFFRSFGAVENHYFHWKWRKLI